MKPIHYCAKMTFEEKRDRVYVYRYRTPDGAREQFTPGVCRICGNPLATAWRVFNRGKLTAEYAPSEPEAHSLNLVMDEMRLGRISDQMCLPVTVCDAIAQDHIWQAAEQKENERKREMARSMEDEQAPVKRARFAGSF